MITFSYQIVPTPNPYRWMFMSLECPFEIKWVLFHGWPKLLIKRKRVLESIGIGCLRLYINL